jgi:hypothetical protein
MRFPNTAPKNGDIRTRTFFAWFPITDADKTETRWLETVTVVEKYYEGIGGYTAPRIARFWYVLNFRDLGQAAK